MHHWLRVDLGFRLVLSLDSKQSRWFCTKCKTFAPEPGMFGWQFQPPPENFLVRVYERNGVYSTSLTQLAGDWTHADWTCDEVIAWRLMDS